MVNKTLPTLLLVALCALGLFSPTQSAHALTAEQYFADGNRLFRDDLYWAALLRYRQAAEEGMSSPLLDYNMGVAHYRAGQHIRAREALTRALGDPELRVTAQYNLGLNAYAAGDSDEALRWFRLARDQNEHEVIQGYAVVAISRIRDERAVPDEFEVRVIEREKKRELADFEFRVRIGYGNDDNVFRSPARPYVDRSDPLSPIVVPEVKSGTFTPVSLSAKYRINSLKYEGFYVAYRLNGRYYDDDFLGNENANEYQQEASFGSEYRRKVEDRERWVHSAFKVAQSEETYYDPDTGGIRDVDGVEVGDRMDYLRYGPELSFRQSHRRLAFGMKIKGQIWDYQEQSLLPEYDHEFMLLNIYGQYKFTESSLLRITAEGYSRRFGDRPAFDLDGQQRADNPNIRYDYFALQLTARQRVFDSLWFGFDIERTERIDQYVGYNDYTRDSVSAELHWTPGNRFDLEARSIYYLYDYPNAFAFQNPASPRKTQESAMARVSGTFRIWRGLSLFAEARYRETVSNDTRIQYERNQYLIGVRWEQ